MVRRFGLTIYWLAFALYTLPAARSPGLVPPGTLVPYPWRGVFETWVVLAVLVGGLHAILRPRTFDRSWSRLAAAFLYSFLLVALAVVTFSTDLPGYMYVPLRFALIMPVGLLILSVVVALQAHRVSTAHAANRPRPDEQA